MKKEQVESIIEKYINYQEVKNFRQLFNLLEQNKLDGDYRRAYDEGAELAKELIEKKTKNSWNADEFEHKIISIYPDLPKIFILALRRCVENYNPPVNIPDEPLW